MSIEVTNKVWLRGPQDAKQTLLLMAIADCANQKGEAFPGVALLAQKSRQSERNALRGILQLEREGWIFVQRRKRGDRARGNEYQINLARLSDEKAAEVDNLSRHDRLSPDEEMRVVNKDAYNTPSDNLSPRENAPETAVHEVTKTSHEVTKSTPRGDKTNPCIENRKEPSIEPVLPPTPLAGGVREDDADVEAFEAEERGSWELRNRIEAKRGGRQYTWEAWIEQARMLRPEKPAPESTVDAEFAACASLEAVVALLMHRLGICAAALVPVLSAALSAEAERSRITLAEAGYLAWCRYRAYASSSGTMRYSWGPRKFFSEGHWLNPGGWPREKLHRRL